MHLYAFTFALSHALFVGRGARPSRCTKPLHSHNLLKSTSIASPRTTTLASLVKGRWIDGKAQVLILLLSACDMPIIFMLQTFCRQDGGIAIPPFAQHHIYASLVKGEVLSPEKIRATTGGIALHHQPFQNRTIPRKSPPPLPPLEKGEVARLIQIFRLLYSIQIVLPLQFWNYSEPWRWGLFPLSTIITLLPSNI